MENKIISVERIFQYTSIPSEPPLIIEENRPDQSWPAFGEIELHNLQVFSFFLFSFWCPLMPTTLKSDVVILS